jgi:hypothetical protein
MTVYKPDNTVRFTEPLTSGNATGSSWPEQIASHTESKGVLDPKIQRGDRVVFTDATRPACPGCRGNMNNAAATKNITIEYNWNNGKGKSGQWKTDPEKARRSIAARTRSAARRVGKGC